MNEQHHPTSGMSATIGKLAEALAKAQAQMRHASKDSTNPHFRSSYADLASVLDAAREPLTANGLSISQLPSHSADGVVVRTILMHTSGEYLWSELAIPVRKNDAQGVGSAITYARRYSLSAIAGIGSDDDDGNAATAAAPAQRERAAPKRNPQQDEKNHLLRGVADEMRRLGLQPGDVAEWCRDYDGASNPKQLSNDDLKDLIEKMAAVPDDDDRAGAA